MNIRSLGETSGAGVWLIDLRRGASVTDASVLDAAERERAARFMFPDDRRRFVTAHVALRLCLSESSGIAPERLRFSQDPRGKPVVETAGAIYFSLSHSADHALVAISTQREVGVDVETLRVLDDLERLAESVCTPAERVALATLPSDSRSAAFLACWTRKEACLKAVGIGLTIDLTRLELGVDGAPRAVRLALEGERVALVRVERVDLDSHGACAAIASVMAA